MAQTPSPRDHDADANSDLSRKRPRLSEEHNSPVHIETLDLEEVGTSFVDAIEIEDDNMPSLYSDDFAIEPNLTTSPFEQIRYFRQECLSDRCVHPLHLYYVSVWLERHLSRTADLNDEVRRQGYLQDDTFFGTFGQACWALLDRRDEAFDETLPPSYPNFGDVLYQFFEQLQVLATRFVQLLPAITTDKFTRRDSAQLKSGHHRVTALCYLHVLRALQVQTVRAPFLQFVRSAFGTDIDKLMRHGQLQFVKNGGSPMPLVTILGNLARNAREVHDAWLSMDSTLLLLRSLISSSGLGGHELAEMVESINSLILPAIREKHPRTLPDDFHAHVIVAAVSGLRARVLRLDVPSVYRIYEDLVQGEGDALLTTPQIEDRSFEALWTICQGNKELLADHVCSAWTLQVEKSFLFSDIIDVRTCGITLLTQELSRCYRNFAIPQGADHPLVQYTSRFLRVNELIRYIFSADSHASLVGHSAEIVGFLVMAQSYTEQETDILWEACTNSAEVEFAKASCTVLRQVCISLDRAQLLYVARQFASTPVSRMTPDIIELLSAVFVGIRTTTPADGSQEIRLASAFVSLDMLRHLAPDTFRSSTNVLRGLAITELSRYVGCSADDRLKIYETCIADLAGRTKHATTSADVLRLFLSSNTSLTEVEKLLDVLPLDTVVNELCAFVQQVANSNRANIHLALMIRLDLILLLMYLTPTSHERTAEDMLFTLLFGDLSLDIYAREEAWKRLTSSTDALPSAQMLLDRYLVEFVPTLHADLATPHLIETILAPLKGRVTADALENTSRILTHPLWQALVRFALDSTHPDVNNAAAQVLRDLLFLYPQSLSSKERIVQSQLLFASDLVDRLCSDPFNGSALHDESTDLRFLRTLKLLGTLLHISRTTHSQFLPPPAIETLSVGHVNSSDMLCFKIQLHSSERQAKVMEVRAPSSATVAQLANAIERITGMAEHRVILAGKELDLITDAQSTLSAAGVHSSGVIMISPRYTFNCDLSAILTPPGPIEQMINEQYHRLERLVDGPKERSVARAAFEFLKTLKPSKVARDRVTSEATPLNQLFSADLPYRTSHSLHILDCQLRDFASLGTVDEAFIVRTVRRIIWFIMEPSVELGLLTDAFAVLRTFLCEHAGSMQSEDPFEKPAAFIERTLALLRTASNLIHERPQDQSLYLLTRTLYLTLVEAFRKDNHIWECFMTNEQTPTVHKHLLLLENLELTTQLAKIIEDFCRERSSPEQALEFYWTLLENTITQALEYTASPTAYFGLACRLLYLRRSDEMELRSFTRSIIRHLWSYSHNESPRLPIPDTAMLGLLKLLQGALVMLRSLKKPLAQHCLPVDLFERLLFPCKNDDRKGNLSYRALVSKEAREIVFDMVKMTCESPDVHQQITAATQQAMLPLSTGDVPHYPGTEDWLRAPTQCSGLTNLGMTCYMNSLLQQLFANLQLRNFLLNIPVINQGQQPMLTHVQHLFASMQGSSKPYVETVALAKALEVQIDSQDDVHGFFATFFSKLEDNMPDRDTKRELSRFFTGKFITQIKGACGHVSTQTEPFIDISITVKNKASLQESLNEFVQGEPMKGANQYRCMTCISEGDKGRLVNAMKRTCLDDVPDNLTFCLKRFTFEAMMGLEGKANDRFEFPAEIDMAVYQRTYLEHGNLPIVPDMFELVGVIVHQGSLEFGHYWSYIRIGGLMDSTKWYLVEDRNVKPILGGIREVQDECFGGTVYPNSNERAESAYVLLYQRASRFNERHQVVQRTPGDERHARSLPPYVPISSELNEMISATNDWHYRVAQLFDPQFSSFMTWLIGSSAMQSDSTIEGSSEDQEERQQSNAIQYSATMDSLATTAASYLLHVVMCDPTTSERLTSFSLPLTKALDASWKLTKLFLDALTSDRIAFHQIWQTENRQTRQLMGQLILSWLESLRSRDEISGRAAAREIIAAHSALLHRHMDFLYPHWPEFVQFVGRLVRLGPFETALVHKAGYIEWAVEILTLDYQSLDLRPRRRLILKAIANNAIDMKILFGLLHDILNEHVDISETTTTVPSEASSKGDHNTRVRLHPTHLSLFFTEMRIKSKSFMVLLIAACRHSSLPRDWREYNAGQFLARLVDDRTDYMRFRQLEMSLLVRFDEESDALEYLLHIVLNICLVRDDHDMIAIMKALARTALSWEDVETEMLDFWYEAIKLAPVATLSAMLSWTEEYLTRIKKAKIRRRTATFLREVLFEQPPLNAHECDTLRIRVTRVLVSKLINQLTHAYHQEIPRRHCEEMMQVLEHARLYLDTLHIEVNRVKELGTDQYKAECLPGALNVEYEESRSTLMDIKRLLNELSEWITDPVSDVSPITLRNSKCTAEARVVSEQDYEGRGFEEDLEEDESFISDNSIDPSLDHAG